MQTTATPMTDKQLRRQELQRERDVIRLAKVQQKEEAQAARLASQLEAKELKARTKAEAKLLRDTQMSENRAAKEKKKAEALAERESSSEAKMLAQDDLCERTVMLDTDMDIVKKFIESMCVNFGEIEALTLPAFNPKITFKDAATAKKFAAQKTLKNLNVKLTARTQATSQTSAHFALSSTGTIEEKETCFIAAHKALAQVTGMIYSRGSGDVVIAEFSSQQARDQFVGSDFKVTGLEGEVLAGKPTRAMKRKHAAKPFEDVHQAKKMNFNLIMK